MQTITKLNDIADIIAGYTFRGSIQENEADGLLVLQAKNISNALTIDPTSLSRANVSTSHTKAFISSGDVAVSSRGVFKAGVIWAEQKILAASSVHLLRIKDKTLVLPEYLAVYINSLPGQRQIRQFLTTGTITTLLKKEMGNINIPLPSIQDQHRIADLDRMIRNQKKLLDRKITTQQNILNGALNQFERTTHE